jgi:hypothetical protein
MTMECNARGVALFSHGADYFYLQATTDIEAWVISKDLNSLAGECSFYLDAALRCSQQKGRWKTDCERVLTANKKDLDDRIRKVREDIERWYDRALQPPTEPPPRKQDVRW